MKHTDIRVPPIMITTMLHCYYSPTPVPNHEASSIYGACQWLREKGLIRKTDIAQYEATLRGQAWVEMICHTVLPEQVTTWVDPRTEEEVAVHNRTHIQS